MTIEDFKLEIRLLQQKDTEDAFNSGYTTKKEWYSYISKQENDKIAKAIIELAKRYKISPQLAAINFDSTMMKRINKYLKTNKEEFKK